MTIEDAIKRSIVIIFWNNGGGESNRISRKHLLHRVNTHLTIRDLPRTSDRTMRNMIEELRQTKDGALICASPRGGYFMARNKHELDEHLRGDENRIKSLGQRIRKQRLAAGLALTKLTQLELFEDNGK